MKAPSRLLSAPAPGQYPGIDMLLRMPRFATAGQVAVQPGLSRIRALLEYLGRPQDSFPVIHVAGTNGKGSTASYIAAILTASGLRCGLHTSPHLVYVGERMRVNGAPASPAELNARILDLEPALAEFGVSYFELTVALSLAYFSDYQVDVAVVEVGLGGRLDATNALDPALSVITRIALDHTEILGDTIEVIAREKGGIIRPGIPLVCGSQQASARDTLLHMAKDSDARFVDVAQEASWLDDATLATPAAIYRGLEPALLGAHQKDNAAAAVMAAETFLAETESRSTHSDPSAPNLGAAGTTDSEAVADAIRSGLRDVTDLAGLRGRFEMWADQPLIILDVGHNPDSVIPALRMFETEAAEFARKTVALALMSNKDLRPIALELARLECHVIPVDLPSERALPAAALAAFLNSAGVQSVGSPSSLSGLKQRAEQLSPDESLLVIGSFQLVGGFLEP